MKITTFNPIIFTKEADKLIALFEELGFEKAHVKEGYDGKDVKNTRMRHPGGFHVDITSPENFQEDKTVIRMNVDNFDEAYELLKSKGFKNFLGHDVETDSSKLAILKSPSGFSINLSQHIKN